MIPYGYRARWRGDDYPACPELRPEGLFVRLYSPTERDGFATVTDNRFVRAVAAAECTAVTYVATVGEWSGVPVHVHTERDERLYVEYAGQSAPQALELGFERVERGVYRTWLAKHEVRGLREQTTLIQAPAN